MKAELILYLLCVVPEGSIGSDATQRDAGLSDFGVK